jgi:hypothetical protein
LNLSQQKTKQRFLAEFLCGYRGMFLKSILKQNIGWYDTTTTTDFASRMTE